MTSYRRIEDGCQVNDDWGEGFRAMAVFVSPKTNFRSNGNQVEDRAILKFEIKKPPKGYDNPLGGFTWPSSDNPTFSFWTPEG